MDMKAFSQEKAFFISLILRENVVAGLPCKVIVPALPGIVLKIL